MANNSSLSKVLVTNSTGLSLNERFTAISSQSVHAQAAQQRRSRSRSRSINRTLSSIDQTTSAANQHLLQELQRKHKSQAALKLKRRSMRNVGGSFGPNGDGGTIKRGTVKAFRVGANGKPIRTNSLTNVATMKADREVSNGRRSLHRVNSSSNLAGRLGPFGPRRPTVGGAAQRVARRRLQRENGRSTATNNFTAFHSRSRSRSRTRVFNKLAANVNPRQQSRDRSISASNKRSRSRSLNRTRSGGIPIKARLGTRSGIAQNSINTGNRRRNYDRRSNSLSRPGVVTGRVQKRQNITQEKVVKAVRGRGRMNRIRERSATVNTGVKNNGGLRSRSRSNTRKGQVGQSYRQPRSGQKDANRPQQQIQQSNLRRRSRSQQRRPGTISNNKSRGKMQNQQQQQHRLRSRSRNGNRGKINQGGSKTINKADLDKELDQYMATTRTENDMDYLLKN
uniref:Chromatin target of PRMT1 protein C-terminal domain-containing protein n=1 Tax=Glossina morsitans morsitans TaxID=37546 RepID=A0A1B0FKI0_GLOMM